MVATAIAGDRQLSGEAQERPGIRPDEVVYTTPINWHFKADQAGHLLRDGGAAGRRL